MKIYRHIFFDLDHTLWDFNRNSVETLTELFFSHQLDQKGIHSADEFIRKYFEFNTEMWKMYHQNKIDRETLRVIRFQKTFSHFNLGNDALSRSFPDEYLQLLPTKTHLFPDAVEVLAYLKEKYFLHLITNGFEHVQWAKLNSSGLRIFFKEIIISDVTGFKKPDKEIFDAALKSAAAIADESIMVGDDIDADISGAISAGWDSVYFNPESKPHETKPTFEITKLSELKQIFPDFRTGTPYIKIQTMKQDIFAPLC